MDMCIDICKQSNGITTNTDNYSEVRQIANCAIKNSSSLIL